MPHLSARFECSLEVKGTADAVSRSFFSICSMDIASGGKHFFWLQNTSKVADSAREQIIVGPEGPDHKKNWNNLRGTVLGHASPTTAGTQLPGLR